MPNTCDNKMEAVYSISEKIEDVNLIADLRIVDERVEEIRNATLRDEYMLKLTEYIVRGFPENEDEVPEALRPYLRYIDELTTITA